MGRHVAALTAFVGALAAFVGCSRDSDSTPASQRDRNLYAVFHDRNVVLTQLEKPTAVMLAGVASRETIASDEPDVVSVDASGALVAHRLGVTRVRSIPNPSSVLLVEVRDLRDLRIEPPAVHLRMRESAVVRLVSGGKPLEGANAEWSTDDPAIARA